MKDYFDIFILARNLTFQGAILQATILAIFRKRQIPIPNSVPVGLTRDFAEDAIKQIQWRSFQKRLIDLVEPQSLEVTVDAIRKFIMPPLIALHAGESFEQIWPPGGPWWSQEKSHDGG